MFCFQCEEALNGEGCTKAGVCGKTDELAKMQDASLYLLKGLAWCAKDISDKEKQEIARFIVDGLFATITNVNFDTEYFKKRIEKTLELREKIKKKYDITCDCDVVNWAPDSVEEIVKKSEAGVLATENEDIRSLKELLMYGLKGVAAYYSHAVILDFSDEEIENYIIHALVVMLEKNDAEELTNEVLSCGSIAVKTMALLDEANTKTYGIPEITQVELGVRKNPGILISGHDLKDLEQLLEQTKDTGVDVYTHGEMLPANAYPSFKKYSHFVGNYGNSWWMQHEEFESFNGPVLMTTNCLVPPKQSYKDRVYTTGVAGFKGLTHIDEKPDGSKDFSTLVEHAKKCSAPKQIETGKIPIGFAHDTVLGLADKVLDAVKSGAITRFIVMAGCDGRHKERNYYTEFAKALPKSTVILTAGCAKYRYNKLDLGDIGGIPRVLDAGQCNDSFSLVVIAQKLAEVLGVGINDLPISYNIAWYEQKAVTVLLALLSLGVKNIMLGPKLPAFVSPAVLDVLVKNFNIQPNSTVEEDMPKLLS